MESVHRLAENQTMVGSHYADVGRRRTGRYRIHHSCSAFLSNNTRHFLVGRIQFCHPRHSSRRILYVGSRYPRPSDVRRYPQHLLQSRDHSRTRFAGDSRRIARIEYGPHSVEPRNKGRTGICQRNSPSLDRLHHRRKQRRNALRRIAFHPRNRDNCRSPCSRLYQRMGKMPKHYERICPRRGEKPIANKR